MGFFSEDNKDQVYNAEPNDENKSSWSHELIGGAAGFEAMKAYNDHVEKNGKPASHALAKEIFAGFASAEIDKLAETKGLDFLDKEKAQHQAKKQAEENGVFGSPEDY